MPLSLCVHTEIASNGKFFDTLQPESRQRYFKNEHT